MKKRKQYALNGSILELLEDKRCKDCASIEPFWRKGFLWWCVVVGKYINPNRFARKFCFRKERE